MGGISLSLNAWHHFEMIFKQSTANVADGSVVVKMDSQVMTTLDPVITRLNVGERWMWANFLNGTYNWAVPLEIWIDDAYLNDSWARVEIGDQASYAACTHTEIQIPTGWSNTDISLPFHPGSFAPGSKVYLFVIDANGDPSPGYLLILANSTPTASPTPTSTPSLAPVNFTPTLTMTLAGLREAPFFRVLNPRLTPAQSQPIRVSIYLGESGKVRLEVYDLNGRAVCKIAGAPLPAGSHVFTWDGGNVGSGMYILRAHGQSQDASGKVVIVR